MLEVKEVIRKAESYLTEVMPEFANLEPELDEVVRHPKDSTWEITFRAQTRPNPAEDGSLASLLMQRRIFKVVEVDAANGSLVAVRNPRVS